VSSNASPRRPAFRAHALRHGAATLTLAADIDIKIAFDTLAHSDARITQDTHQSALPHTGKNAAEATAKLDPLQHRAEAQGAARQAEEAQGAARRTTQHKSQVTSYVTWPLPEPPSGFEPETYALRDHEGSCCVVPGHANE